MNHTSDHNNHCRQKSLLLIFSLYRIGLPQGILNIHRGSICTDNGTIVYSGRVFNCINGNRVGIANRIAVVACCCVGAGVGATAKYRQDCHDTKLIHKKGFWKLYTI